MYSKHYKYKTQNVTDIKKSLLHLKKTSHAVSWKFTVQPVEALLNKHSLEKQNGVAAAESCVRCDTAS
jgi:hypothetical protein